MSLQNLFINQNGANQFDIKATIKNMIPQIEASVGAAMSQEIEAMLSSMVGLLDENLT